MKPTYFETKKQRFKQTGNRSSASYTDHSNLLLGRQRERTNMCDQWRSDWSRHCDQTQWTAITIFTGMIGALLTYSYHQKGADFDPLIAFLGLWLTWLTIYYVASFKEFRRVLHNGLPEGDEKDFLQNKLNEKRIIWQWPAFLLTFTLLTIGWLWQFWQHGNHGWAIAFAIVFIVGVLSIWRRMKRI